MSRHDSIRGQFVLPFAATMSTGDAAAMIRCSTETVRSMLEGGELKGYRVSLKKKKSPWIVYRWSVERHIARLYEKYALDEKPSHPTSANSAPRTRAPNHSRTL